MILKIIHNTKYYHILMVLVVSMCLSSCSWTYRANTVFMPAFEEKGDIVAEASLGSGDLSVNAGYAITNRLAVTASYQNRNEKKFTPFNCYSELGLALLPKSKTNISLEFLSGVGYGNFKSHLLYRSIFFNSYEQFINTEYLRSNLQVNAYFRYYDLTFSIGGRLSHAHFMNFEDLTREIDDNDKMDFIQGSKINHIYYESVIGCAYDFQHFSLFTQGGLLLLMDGSQEYFTYDPFVLNLGIRFKMNPLTRSIAKEK